MKLKQRCRFRDLPKAEQKRQADAATRELVEFVLSKMATDLDAIVLYALANDFVIVSKPSFFQFFFGIEYGIVCSP